LTLQNIQFYIFVENFGTKTLQLLLPQLYLINIMQLNTNYIQQKINMSATAMLHYIRIFYASEQSY